MASDEMIGYGRQVSECASCHQVDDHPKCSGDDGSFHFDCHAEMGCPGCAGQIEHAGGATGRELLDHILAGSPATEGA